MRKAKISTVKIEQVEKWLAQSGAGANVLRSKVALVSDDLLQSGTLRNDDSAGRGPTERILFNGKVAYPRRALAKYMVQRGLKIERRVKEVANA